VDIASSGILNRVKAGSSVPVKFSLGGYQGNALQIFAPGYPRVVTIPCEGTPDPISGGELEANGTSGLNYDAAADQYNYVWKTEGSWANSCRQNQVRFKDGTEQRANFNFTR
jgi:hypothetical protein